MEDRTNGPPVATIPSTLFFSTLPAGEQELFCFVAVPPEALPSGAPVALSWTIASAGGEATVTGSRAVAEPERASGRIPVAAVLPAGWGEGTLAVELRVAGAFLRGTWPVARWRQELRPRLPLAGQVLVAVGHRIGETHRSAWQVPSQAFGWDLLPLGEHGWSVLTGPAPEVLRVEDFAGYGQPVLAPAAGTVAQVIAGLPDLALVGQYPEDLAYYLEDVTRAAGNTVVIDHGEGVYSCLCHLRDRSILVGEGQRVDVGQVVGALGSSGFSSGPHLHLHFMDGPDMRAAAPLPVQLWVEGRMHAPQAGDIISSD